MDSQFDGFNLHQRRRRVHHRIGQATRTHQLLHQRSRGGSTSTSPSRATDLIQAIKGLLAPASAPASSILAGSTIATIGTRIESWLRHTSSSTRRQNSFQETDQDTSSKGIKEYVLARVTSLTCMRIWTNNQREKEKSNVHSWLVIALHGSVTYKESREEKERRK